MLCNSALSQSLHIVLFVPLEQTFLAEDAGSFLLRNTDNSITDTEIYFVEMKKNNTLYSINTENCNAEFHNYRACLRHSYNVL